MVPIPVTESADHDLDRLLPIDFCAHRWPAAALLAAPTLGWAQESPFLTGATALQTNILAWMTPVAIILVMVLGRHGNGKPNVLGLVSVRGAWESPSYSARRRS